MSSWGWHWTVPSYCSWDRSFRANTNCCFFQRRNCSYHCMVPTARHLPGSIDQPGGTWIQNIGGSMASRLHSSELRNSNTSQLTKQDLTAITPLDLYNERPPLYDSKWVYLTDALKTPHRGPAWFTQQGLSHPKQTTILSTDATGTYPLYIPPRDRKPVCLWIMICTFCHFYCKMVLNKRLDPCSVGCILHFITSFKTWKLGESMLKWFCFFLSEEWEKSDQTCSICYTKWGLSPMFFHDPAWNPWERGK